MTIRVLIQLLQAEANAIRAMAEFTLAKEQKRELFWPRKHLFEAVDTLARSLTFFMQPGTVYHGHHFDYQAQGASLFAQASGEVAYDLLNSQEDGFPLEAVLGFLEDFAGLVERLQVYETALAA